MPTDGRNKSDTLIPWPNLDYGLFTDGQEQVSRGDGKLTKGATPFQASIKEIVESLNRPGYPELTVRPDNDPAMRSIRDAAAKFTNIRFGYW